MNETTKEALFQAQTAIQLVLELQRQKPDTGTYKYAESGDRVWRAGGEYAPQAGDKMPASDPRPATYGVDLDPMAVKQLELAAEAITYAENSASEALALASRPKQEREAAVDETDSGWGLPLPGTPAEPELDLVDLVDAVATLLDVDTGMFSHERMAEVVRQLRAHLLTRELGRS